MSPKKREMRAAVEGLIRDSGEKARCFAYRLSNNHEEARELVQEALYRLIRSWKRYDASRSLERWFLSILWHAFLDSRKRIERRKCVSLDAPSEEEGKSYGDLILDERQNPIQELERAAAARDVRSGLGRLSTDHRSVLRLCDMDGLQYGEIARSLGVPIGTVRSRISRARKALRNKTPTLAEVFAPSKRIYG